MIKQTTGDNKRAARYLFQEVVMDELLKEQNKEKLEKYSVDVSQVKLKTSFSQHIIFTAARTLDLRTIAKILSKRPEVLAVEWLNKKIIYGVKAEIEEMSNFKTKVKKIIPLSEQIDKQSDKTAKEKREDYKRKDVIDLDEMPKENADEILKKIKDSGIKVKRVGGEQEL